MESEERIPLLDGRRSSSSSSGGVRMGEITNKGSVYSCMVLMPPLSRRMYGHYCTAEVGLSFFLFAMAVTLQTVLSGLAGVHIFEEQANMQASLYTVVNSDELWTFHEEFIDRLGQQVQDTFLPSKDTAAQRQDDREGKERPRHQPCCGGVACAGQGLKCCSSGTRANGGSGGAGLENSTHAPSPAPMPVSSSAMVPSPQPAMSTAFSRPAEAILTKAASFLQRKPGGGGAGGGGHGAAKNQRGDGADDAAEQAACLDTRQGLSCTPPSARLFDLWNRLDTNGDGIWTLAEAQADEANVGCIVGVALVDVMQSACRGLVRDRAETAFMTGQQPPELPYEVRHRTALPWAYFNWWRGLTALCISTDVALCGDMVSRGLFDGLLHPNISSRARGGVTDLDTAMSYCQRLIQPGGVCDAALPGSYVMYRARLQETCGAATYTAGPRYRNPHSEHDIISTTKVSYANLDVYKNIHGAQFLFFLALVLLLWYINLVDELKDILSLWDFVWGFPNDADLPFLTPAMSKRLRKIKRNIKDQASNVRERLGRGANRLGQSIGSALGRREVSAASSVPAGDVDVSTMQEESLSGEAPAQTVLYTSQASAVDSDDSTDSGDPGLSPRTVEIKSIDVLHKMVCVAMAIIRTFVLIYLAWAGTEFMLMNLTYIDLLLNSLAIAFIFELDEFLYLFLVPETVKERLDSLKPLRFVSSLPQRGCLKLVFEKHFWGLIIIPFIVIAYVVHHDQTNTVPRLEALQCACLHTGDRCLDRKLFQEDWWAEYWSSTSLISS
eukprot:TRINITY_DN63385_c0_g1_i1.p1 TRINITY_DN63385_c0_g1~~TRINITY_DN63385_c0_g1_i1.p1  ORF type:complete len:782 (+),score=126.47 TRINITY_DN63385_c0_g1_i1:82-2427(+)